MKKDAIINGKRIMLPDDERINAEQFHRKRIPFIWIDGTLHINVNENDDRDHQHWVLDDFGILPEQWETLNRGYMLPGKIQLFRSSRFEKIPNNEIDLNNDDFKTLVNLNRTVYKQRDVTVYNGVYIGKVGEIWPPIEELYTFTEEV